MSDDANDPASPPPSPCVRNCCLDEQDVCIGCGRSLAEITGWHEAGPDEKRAILARSRERLARRPDPWRPP